MLTGCCGMGCCMPYPSFLPVRVGVPGTWQRHITPASLLLPPNLHLRSAEAAFIGERWRLGEDSCIPVWLPQPAIPGAACMTFQPPLTHPPPPAPNYLNHPHPSGTLRTHYTRNSTAETFASKFASAPHKIYSRRDRPGAAAGGSLQQQERALWEEREEELLDAQVGGWVGPSVRRSEVFVA